MLAGSPRCRSPLLRDPFSHSSGVTETKLPLKQGAHLPLQNCAVSNTFPFFEGLQKHRESQATNKVLPLPRGWRAAPLHRTFQKQQWPGQGPLRQLKKLPCPRRQTVTYSTLGNSHGEGRSFNLRETSDRETTARLLQQLRAGQMATSLWGSEREEKQQL